MLLCRRGSPESARPARQYWNEVSEKTEVALSITGSQNYAYCGLFFGYEWFLVRCFRALGGGAGQLQFNPATASISRVETAADDDR